jgi:streptogramin lyase
MPMMPARCARAQVLTRGPSFVAAISFALLFGCAGHASIGMPTPSQELNGRPEIEQGNRHGDTVKFKIPTPGSGPNAIVAGPDGNMWFIETFGNKVGRITMSGTITEYAIPTAGAQPYQITAGPDGNLWFVEDLYPPQVGRITTAGQVTEFPLGYAFGCPESIVAGSDGALWFGDVCKDGIGRITTDGVVSPLYPISSEPRYLAAGPDGNVWFTELNRSLVGKVTPTGGVTEYPLPQGTYGEGILAGPDGNLWFVDGPTGDIDRITTDGVFKQFNGDGAVGAFIVAPSPPGFSPKSEILFISDIYEKTIEQFSILSKGVLRETQIGRPAEDHQMNWVAPGPDHNMWFTSFAQNEVGVYVLDTMTVSPASVILSVGQSQDVVISEKRYSGSWTAASSNDNVATVAPGQTSSDFVVTAVGVGKCTVTISDSLGNSIPVPVRVQ